MVIKRGGEMERVAKLSPRRREVFDLLVSGKSSREIGEILGVSTGTVGQHRSAINMLLGTQNAVQVLMLAIRVGLAGGK